MSSLELFVNVSSAVAALIRFWFLLCWRIALFWPRLYFSATRTFTASLLSAPGCVLKVLSRCLQQAAGIALALARQRSRPGATPNCATTAAQPSADSDDGTVVLRTAVQSISKLVAQHAEFSVLVDTSGQATWQKQMLPGTDTCDPHTADISTCRQPQVNSPSSTPVTSMLQEAAAYRTSAAASQISATPSEAGDAISEFGAGASLASVPPASRHGARAPSEAGSTFDLYWASAARTHAHVGPPLQTPSGAAQQEILAAGAAAPLLVLITSGNAYTHLSTLERRMLRLVCHCLRLAVNKLVHRGRLSDAVFAHSYALAPLAFPMLQELRLQLPCSPDKFADLLARTSEDGHGLAALPHLRRIAFFEPPAAGGGSSSGNSAHKARRFSVAGWRTFVQLLPATGSLAAHPLEVLVADAGVLPLHNPTGGEGLPGAWQGNAHCTAAGALEALEILCQARPDVVVRIHSPSVLPLVGSGSIASGSQLAHLAGSAGHPRARSSNPGDASGLTNALVAGVNCDAFAEEAMHVLGGLKQLRALSVGLAQLRGGRVQGSVLQPLTGLLALDTLALLCFGKLSLTREAVEVLAQLPVLRVLTFEIGSLTQDAASALPRLLQLEKLLLTARTQHHEGSVMPVSAGSRAVDSSFKDMPQVAGPLLAAITRCPALTSLDVAGRVRFDGSVTPPPALLRLGAAACKSLVPLAGKLAKLTSLSLRAWPGASDISKLAELVSLTSLALLRLRPPGDESAPIAVITQVGGVLRGALSLQHLRLEEHQGHEMLRPLLEAASTTLQELVMVADTAIAMPTAGHGGTRHGGPLRRGLMAVAETSTVMVPPSVQLFAGVAKSLHSLEINGEVDGSSVAWELLAVQGWPKLEQLKLRHVPMGTGQVEELRSKAPCLTRLVFV